MGRKRDLTPEPLGRPTFAFLAPLAVRRALAVAAALRGGRPRGRLTGVASSSGSSSAFRFRDEVGFEAELLAIAVLGVLPGVADGLPRFLADATAAGSSSGATSSSSASSPSGISISATGAAGGLATSGPGCSSGVMICRGCDEPELSWYCICSPRSGSSKDTTLWPAAAPGFRMSDSTWKGAGSLSLYRSLV